MTRGSNCKLICDLNEGNYPLHIAMKRSNIELIMTLIGFGGSLNSLNKEKHTPIAYGS